MARTKFVCTIGPETCSEEGLRKLAEGGMAVVRLNMSHGDHAWHRSVIERVRAINAEGEHCLAVMLDTKGPEVRSGDRKEALELKRGDTFTFTVRHAASYDAYVSEVNYDGFYDDVDVGDTILIDGGLLRMRVREKRDKDIVCEVLDDGVMTARRHINVLGKSANLPSITDSDWKDIDFGVAEGVDFVALSFVKSPDAVLKLKEYLTKKGSSAAVIAKIESAEAVVQLRSIIEVSDGAMVARGDLGAEIPLEDVPIVQEEIVRICRSLGKPVIVATHMLESMIEHPTPTRAEVTDIARAVEQMTDATMLSGETAAGKYPFKSLKIMRTVAERMEGKLLDGREPVIAASDEYKDELSQSAALMADHLGAPALLVFTRSGHMAGLVAKCRPKTPIYAFANTEVIRRRLALIWGTTPFAFDFPENPEDAIRHAISILRERQLLASGDRIVVVSDILAGEDLVDTVQIRTLA